MPDPTDLVLMLNQNARRVTTRVQRSFARVMPQIPTYSSRSLEEARAQLWEAMDQGYHRIVCGGGDGTIVQMLNMVREYVDDKNAQLQQVSADVREQWDRVSFPKIGILKLGTGNGWAFDVRSRKPLEALRRMLEEVDLPTRRFHLLESEERVFHFSGLGYDAAVLNDYYLFKQRFGRGLLAPWFKGIGGYLTALLLKSAPENLLQPPPIMRVVNGDSPVYAVDAEGTPHELPVGPGDTVYEGPVTVTGAGTTTSYGYGFRAFPFAAAREGFFNFRIVSARVLECLAHAPSIFRGTYRAPSFQDFLARDLTLEFDRPMPYQIGGDSQGYRERLDYKVSDLAVDVYDFAPA